MRRLATLAVLGMLGTALLVSGLHAQANPSLGVEGHVDKNRQLTKIGGVYVDANGDTVVVRGRFTINGDQVVEATDPARDRDMVLLQPSFITTRFVYGADGVSAGWTTPKCVTADSTSVLANTLGYSRLALLITVSFEDSVGAALFAVQWRGAAFSPSSDTTNTFINISNRSTSADTIGSFAGMNPPLLRLWGWANADTSTLLPGERFMALSRTEFGSGVMVNVKNADGSWFAPPYFGLRWRIMNTYLQATGGGGLVAIGSSGKAYGSAPAVPTAGVCEMCGGQPTANPVAWGRWVILRADLVGWRD